MGYPYGKSEEPKPKKITLTAEQSQRVNALVLKEYRRTFHWYRALTDFDRIYILDWTLDTFEGRDAYRDAIELVEGTPKAQQP